MLKKAPSCAQFAAPKKRSPSIRFELAKQRKGARGEAPTRSPAGSPEPGETVPLKGPPGDPSGLPGIAARFFGLQRALNGLGQDRSSRSFGRGAKRQRSVLGQK
ncbi:MAG: hypothetical protein Q8P67_27090 [archaeon]|nr:hypothetical protein [archaeon]